ncbi:interleukin-6 [Cavia porcellus]|uniref:interleukin-6 n=1 Tax=Cavia porcellus TaxID=10141 RepID=UPI000661B962|nr:interleukin-6 [Cavia porcellus]
MKFLSTSTFRPLAFLGLLLVSVTAFPTAQVQHDFTADTTDEMTTAEMTTTMPNKPTTSASQVFQMFMRVYQAVKELKNEMNKHNVEKAILNNLDLPKLKLEDGCFFNGYNWETCQLKITPGLFKFQTYLQSMQNKLQNESENKKAANIYAGIKSLSLFMKSKINNTEQMEFLSPTPDATLLEKLETQSQTQMLLIAEIVLQRLEEFLQDSLRAIRKADWEGRN